MRSLLLLLALVSLVLTFPASADNLQLPPDKPIVSVNIPDAWRPEFVARVVQSQTGDGNAYLTVAATTDAKEMAAIIDKSDAMLRSRKVKLDRATRRNTPFKVNGFPAEEIRYVGIDDHGSVTVTFTFVTIHDAAIVFTYLANEAGHQAHQAELGKIIDSVQVFKPTTPAAVAATP